MNGVPWIVVLSYHARKQYLDETLKSIDRNGGGCFFDSRKVVMFDGPKRDVSHLGWETASVCGGTVLATPRSMWIILRAAFRAGCPYVLYFEDDVFVCRNAILAMISMEVPDGVAFLSFCNQKVGCDSPDVPHVEARRADAFANRPGHWGNQAIKVPRRTLELVAKAEPPNQWVTFGSDVWLGERVAARTSPENFYGIVLPAFVRHTGRETSIQAQQNQKWEGHRLGLNYAGDEADALELAQQVNAGGVREWSKNEDQEIR